MDIPRHWHKASETLTTERGEWELNAWGWDDHEPARAADLARERLAGLVNRVRRDGKLGDKRWYGYGDRPMREERIDELPGANGPRAILTRSAAGPVVLNAAHAMFVDIDLPNPRRQEVGWLGKLLGKKPTSEQQESALDRVREVARETAGFAAKVYRTSAGLRLLLTHKPYDPTGDESQHLLKRLRADPLFTTLCKRQRCFRARLSAKPWRIDMEAPPQWPLPADRAAEAREWQERYLAACHGTTACDPLPSIGANTIHPEIEPVLKLHDHLACRGGRLA